MQPEGSAFNSQDWAAEVLVGHDDHDFGYSLRSNKKEAASKGSSGGVLNHFLQTDVEVGLENWSLQSPVYTLFVTAQALSAPEPGSERQTPLSEVRLQATVERTFDGKMNILEFKWLPSF